MEGTRTRNPIATLKTLVSLALMLAAIHSTHAQEAQWIWAPGVQKERIPEGRTCYFRKTFNVRAQVTGRVTIAADDAYELYVNGRRINDGTGAKKLSEVNITRHLAIGRNVVAAKVTNTRGNTAALAARVQIKAANGEKWFSFSSDASWKVATSPQPMWQTALYLSLIHI